MAYSPLPHGVTGFHPLFHQMYKKRFKNRLPHNIRFCSKSEYQKH